MWRARERASLVGPMSPPRKRPRRAKRRSGNAVSSDRDPVDDPSYQSAPNMRGGVVEYCSTDEYISYRKCKYLEEVRKTRDYLTDHLGPCKYKFDAVRRARMACDLCLLSQPH